MPAPKKKTGYRYKMIGDQQVRPVLYNGKASGHGKYMAAEYVTGGLVTGASDRPKTYASI